MRRIRQKKLPPRPSTLPRCARAWPITNWPKRTGLYSRRGNHHSSRNHLDPARSWQLWGDLTSESPRSLTVFWADGPRSSRTYPGSRGTVSVMTPSGPAFPLLSWILADGSMRSEERRVGKEGRGEVEVRRERQETRK